MIDYLNGQWTDGPAMVRGTDRGLLLGDGVFETLAVRDGKVWRVAAHLERLRRDAEMLGISVPNSDVELEGVLAEAAKRNDITDGLVRLTLTRGPILGGLAVDGDAPTLLVTARARVPQVDPVTTIIATSTRRNEHSPLSQVKSTSYLDGIMVAREAHAKGADEAILLNTSGRVAEASISNLLAVIDGGLVTPPVTDGALPGIMRAAIMALEPVEERHLESADLLGADEVMLTNSGGVRSVVSIDGETVGTGKQGPAVARLQAAVWKHEGDLSNE